MPGVPSPVVAGHPRPRPRLGGVRRRERDRSRRPHAAGRADRRRGRGGRRDRIRADAVRPIRSTVRRARLRRRRRRVGEGRDRGSGRQPEGPPPVHDPAAPAGGRAPRAPHRTTAAGDRLVRQRRARRSDARRRRRLADRRLRPDLDDATASARNSTARRHGPPLRAPSDDPPGDPAMLRFREAVAAGAIPFTVQGPENALALDGGRTLGWEIAEQAERAPTRPSLRAGRWGSVRRVRRRRSRGHRRRRPAPRRPDRGLRAARAGLGPHRDRTSLRGDPVGTRRTAGAS